MAEIEGFRQTDGHAEFHKEGDLIELGVVAIVKGLRR
jgi:hypothetical protein